MYDNDRAPAPGVGAGLAAAVAGMVLGAAVLLLSTKQGRKILEQVGIQADDWKAQAAAALAESREKVVRSVDAETPSGSAPSDPGPQVRKNL